MSTRVDQILQELHLSTDTCGLSPREIREMARGERPKIETKKCVCGKSAWDTKAQADKAAHHRLRKGNGGTSFLRSYKCDVGHGWHLTSRKPTLA